MWSMPQRIHLGLCDVALVVYAGLPRSSRGGIGALVTGPRAEWELPYGILLPTGAYALAASRHMAQYGTRAEHLAQIAVSTREWAALNPRARLQKPLTLDEAMSSPVIASPLRKIDCCLVTDGAGAIVMTSAERARDLRRPPIYVLGAATSHSHSSIMQMPDLTETCGVESGSRAFAMAGIQPADVDVAELYDSFTITVLLALEDLGFCKKGEGGEFVASGALDPGGALPAQTSGGGLCYTHPGMFGIFLLVEAVRQLRGECGPRQVEGARVAVAHGCGGVLSATSTVVLGTGETL
jgi:acetyl-CoA acetyltransferase